jgi:hypothetical protein
VVARAWRDGPPGEDVGLEAGTAPFAPPGYLGAASPGGGR